MSHITKEMIIDVRVYVESIARFGLHDVGHRLTAQRQLLILLEKALDQAFEQFKEDSVAAFDALLCEQRRLWVSESFALFRDQIDNDN